MARRPLVAAARGRRHAGAAGRGNEPAESRAARQHARDDAEELAAKLPVQTQPPRGAARGARRRRPVRRPRPRAVARRRVHDAVTRVDARRAHARPAARRARARPVRGTGRQDDAHRGADGRRGRRSSPSSATRVARRRWSAHAERMHAANVTVQVGDAARFATRDVRPRARRPAVQRPRDAAGPPRPALAHDAGVDRDDGAGAGEHPARGRGALAPGGTLVYSTCTLSPGENEQQAAAAGLRLESAAPRAAPPRPNRRLLHRPHDRMRKP